MTIHSEMKSAGTAPAQGTPLLEIAVVGHTNTGKTSLIRTLLRSTRFGRVEDAAGTTRHVERATIFAGSEAVLNLHDTPGIEDVYALQDRLHVTAARNKRLTPVELLEKFVAATPLNDSLEQEAKVIRQVLRSDVLLYVIDVREPVLEKYLIEIETLGKAMKPMIPVFNFTASHRAELDLWRKKLAAFNIYASLELDTVAFAFEAEKRLYQKIQSLLEDHYTRLQRLIDHRARVWNQLCMSAARRIAGLIITAACYREHTGQTGNTGGDTRDLAEASSAAARLQDFVRQAEQHCLADLLKMFNFTDNDIELQKIPVQNGYWQLDLFAPGVLKAYGLDVGSAALKGAAAGAGIDLMVGGLSLGAASILGALAGTGWSTFKRYGREIQAKIKGTRWLCADDTTLQLLYLRQHQLLDKLMNRGHAACHTDQVGQPPERGELPEDWQQIIDMLRQNPAWGGSSALHDHDARYGSIEKRLTDALLKSPAL
ncbi:DUF3482 domain-containing protein [Nitrosomonas sp.]|uniref:DUF3482 domain-containing protein n=1 Tax=Nitrosomonas sp. TaxID=42353 RepID=UPI0025D7F7E6|nr:DUF3482 domain-containing protein [Nitrosomonas sp.]MCC6916811.1 DUF3482 domain-containing protein [Nitrosomonas sp.]